MTWGDVHADFDHMITKGLAVLCEFNGSDIDTDQSHIIFFPDTAFISFYRKVEGSLSTHSGKDCINLPFLKDLDDAVDSQGEEIYVVGGDRVGHDRSRIAVDQADFYSFFA